MRLGKSRAWKEEGNGEIKLIQVLTKSRDL